VVDGIELPDFELPEPELPEPPDVLVDSALDFIDHVEALQAWKRYAG
jgi:hypothetical protein